MQSNQVPTALPKHSSLVRSSLATIVYAWFLATIYSTVQVSVVCYAKVFPTQKMEMLQSLVIMLTTPNATVLPSSTKKATA